MKHSTVIAFLLFIFVGCRTSKEAISTTKKSTVDPKYIATFHNAVRYKVKGQWKEAIQTFDSCFLIRQDDDAVAYGLAQCYQAIKEPAKALEYTEKASKIDPENAWYTQELAYMYYGQGRLVDAEKCFAKLVQKEPRNVDFAYGRAEILKQLNRQQDAIDMYDKVEDQMGVVPEISIQKFELYRSIKQDEKGIKELNEARKTYPDDLSLIGTLVDYYFSTNQISKAQEMLSELVKADPGNARAHLALGDMLYRQYKKDEAYEHFQKAFEGTQLDLDLKMQVLVDLYNQQAVVDNRLLQLAETLLASYPNDAKPLSILGDIYLKKNDSETALRYYQKAIQFETNKFALWNQVLIMEYELKKFDDLYRDARACSALYPAQSSVQLFYVIACNQLGRFQEAIDAALIGKELVVNDPETESEFYAQKAQAEFSLKQSANGISDYENALKISPRNLSVKNNYAMHLALAKIQLDKALILINEVLLEAPENLVFLDTKGLVLFRQGKYDEAYALFSDCVAKNDKEPLFYDHLGDAYSKMGNAVKAVDSWKNALNLGSKNKTLNKKIETKTYVDPQF